MNILTAVVVIGVLTAGYFVFINKQTPVANVDTSVAQIAEETASIGTEIDSTVRDLKDLERAVASSKVIFDLPAFQNLQDFSVAVPTEAVGRTNPFVPTAWKLKMKALEAADAKRAGTSGATSQSSTQSASATPAQSQAGGSTLGDFGASATSGI